MLAALVEVVVRTTLLVGRTRSAQIARATRRTSGARHRGPRGEVGARRGAPSRTTLWLTSRPTMHAALVGQRARRGSSQLWLRPPGRPRQLPRTPAPRPWLPSRRSRGAWSSKSRIRRSCSSRVRRKMSSRAFSRLRWRIFWRSPRTWSRRRSQQAGGSRTRGRSRSVGCSRPRRSLRTTRFICPAMWMCRPRPRNAPRSTPF
mmetsp:Transcript_73590/g.213160  ORF Transcript_73590/g.213160 Transcript_73590/m.213160 type:complete len:203 (-) Transcript_73590:890-1498(-)